MFKNFLLKCGSFSRCSFVRFPGWRSMLREVRQFIQGHRGKPQNQSSLTSVPMLYHRLLLPLCGSQTVVPKEAHFLMPWTCECYLNGKRKVADVMKYFRWSKISLDYLHGPNWILRVIVRDGARGTESEKIWSGSRWGTANAGRWGSKRGDHDRERGLKQLCCWLCNGWRGPEPRSSGVSRS